MAVFLLGGGFAFSLLRATNKRTNHGYSLGLLTSLFIVSLILRLAFLTELYVPPYYDSAEHFRLIKELVDALESSTLLATLPTLTPTYYHLGFHVFASLLTFYLHTDPIDVILVLGQVTLAVLPLLPFFLIQHETQNDAAAFFGTILAGFGWYMPGFAINWGKYPALVGLLAFELVLSVAYFIYQQKTNRFRNLTITFLILSILISILFHSRTLVIIVISFASWFIAGKLSGLAKKIQYLIFGVSLVGILLLGLLVWQEPLLSLALDPYLDDGLWVTLVVAVLSPFAFIRYPKGAYFNTLFILFTLPTLFIPIGNLLPGFENQTLLDRPFVEMILYLPLALLGGLGLTGLLRTLNEINVIPGQLRSHARTLTVTVFLGFVILIPFKDYDLYPSDCCNFVGYDDIIAFDWLNKNTPPDATILIPSTQMLVLTSGPAESPIGIDGGIWIPALSGRTTSFTAFDTDFQSESTLEQLCQEQIEYVYVGGTEQSFDAMQLQAEPGWYDAILSLPDVQLFELTGCSR